MIKIFKILYLYNMTLILYIQLNFSWWNLLTKSPYLLYYKKLWVKTIYYTVKKTKICYGIFGSVDILYNETLVKYEHAIIIKVSVEHRNWSKKVSILVFRMANKAFSLLRIMGSYTTTFLVCFNWTNICNKYWPLHISCSMIII